MRKFCRRILESGNLDAKLAPPVGSSGEDLPDEPAGLSGEFIAFVRGARSSQEQSPGRSSRRNDG
ncbi:MAG: hypothetical protein ACC649_04950 [Myxococcota bacterium]